MTIVIKDWDKHFENAQSRKVERLHWVPLPNKHDSVGFRRIAAMRNRAEIFTGWVLLVELASKMPKRGILADSGGTPLSCTEMALMTGFPEALFENAVEALKDPKIGWIEEIPSTGSALPVGSQSAPSSWERGGTEGNRTEQKGREQKRTEESSAEAPTGLAAALAHVVLSFPCIGRPGDPKEWGLTDAKLLEYTNAYPGVDAQSEARKARQWCIDNPTRRKTARGMAAFLNRWMERVQNDRRGHGPRDGGKSIPGNARQNDERRASLGKLGEEISL